MFDILIGFRAVRRFHIFGVVNQFLTAAIREATEENRFGNATGVIEVARRRAGPGAVFDRFNPFGVVAERLRNRLRRTFEAFEFFLRKKGVFPIRREKNPVGSEEENAGAVFFESEFLQAFRTRLAVLPRQRQRFGAAVERRELVFRGQVPTAKLGVGGTRRGRFDRKGIAESERPER